MLSSAHWGPVRYVTLCLAVQQGGEAEGGGLSGSTKGEVPETFPTAFSSPGKTRGHTAGWTSLWTGKHGAEKKANTTNTRVANRALCSTSGLLINPLDFCSHVPPKPEVGGFSSLFKSRESQEERFPLTPATLVHWLNAQGPLKKILDVQKHFCSYNIWCSDYFPGCSHDG